MMSHRFFSLFVIFFYFRLITAYTKCDGKDGLRCCSGYKWDEKHGNCRKCPSGYYGLNCSKICPYPKYGEKCKMECSCGVERCNIAHGCVSTEPYTDIPKERETFSTMSLRTSVKQPKENKRKSIMSTERTSPTLIGLETKSIMSNSTKAADVIQPVPVPTLAHQNTLINDEHSGDKQTYQSFHFAVEVGMASILLFFFFLVFAHLTQKLVGRLRTNQIHAHKPREFSRESDHYHSLENIDQNCPLISERNLLFEGPAEVKIKFDTERKSYTVGFQTNYDVNKEGHNGQRMKPYDKIKEETDTKDMKEECAYNATNDNTKVVIMSPKDTDEQSKLIAKTDYIEMKSTDQSGDTANPYLTVIKDN